MGKQAGSSSPEKRRFSFRAKLMVALVAISLLMTVYLVGTLYSLSAGMVYDMASELSVKNASFAYTLIERHLDRAGNSVVQMIRLDSLREVISAADGEDVPASSARRLGGEIDEIMTYSSAESIGFSFVNIYCKNGFSFSSSNIELPYDDYESCTRYYIDGGYMSEGYNPSSWCELVLTKDSIGREYYSLINLRVLYHPATYEEVGLLIAALDERNLRSQYTPYFDEALIMHANGQIISSNNTSDLGRSMKGTQLYESIVASPEPDRTISYVEDGVEKMLSYSRQSYWNVYFIIPFEYYRDLELSKTRQFQTSGMIITLGALILSICAAVWISAGLYSSIRKLREVVDAVRGGDADARYNAGGRDEIAYLGGSFNDMLDTLGRNHEASRRQERVNGSLELKLMQAQINPHLLYNTLDSVLWAMNNHDTGKANDLLLHLSRFFKLSLSRGSDVVTLESELSLVQSYIEIQRLARGKDYTLSVAIPDDMAEMKLPKLTLQPIIENAVLHGFSGYRDDGRIDIFQSAGGAGITVRDNGIGMPQDEADRLTAFLDTYPPPEMTRSFGLYNVNRRLKGYFGHGGGISVKSVVGEFTEVEVSFGKMLTGGESDD